MVCVDTAFRYDATLPLLVRVVLLVLRMTYICESLGRIRGNDTTSSSDFKINFFI
jgi:hypothetical protein